MGGPSCARTLSSIVSRLVKNDRFHWARVLAFVTGLVNQELLLRNEYLTAENRILRAHLSRRLRLSDAERPTLAEIGYAASPTSAVGAPCRNGSYTSPLIHSRCNSTGNFRATATAARFFAFFPPLSHTRSPYRRKSVSGPNGPRI